MSDRELKTMAHARVTVTMEIDVGDAWGGDCNVAQIHKQAIVSALGKISDAHGRFPGRIIGEPKVTAILVDAEAVK